MSKKIEKYNGEPVEFIEKSFVKEGVVCDVYSFQNTQDKDLGIINITKGSRSPRQLVVDGDQTYQIYRKGIGYLRIWSNENSKEPSHVYTFPGDEVEILVRQGEVMEWEALEDLEFAEVCIPPYKDGRFKNLENF